MITPRLHQSHENVYPWPLMTSGDTVKGGRPSATLGEWFVYPKVLLYEFVPQLAWQGDARGAC